MAKKKAAVESSLDEMFETSLDVAQKKYPDLVYTGGEESMTCLCLPVPGLAPRVLLQQEGWPLGRFYLLDGRKESFKSSLGYEFIRWHRTAGGKGTIIEVEEKKSPEMALSINNYDPKAFITHYCGDTMNDWNAALKFWIFEWRKIMDGDPNAKLKYPGSGRGYPICFLVDSIMAAVAKEISDNIEKMGFAEKHFARDASMLSDYLKVATKWVGGFPYSVVAINHLKPTMNAHTGREERHMPGGKAPEYHATTDIEVRKLKEDKTVSFDYATLLLKTQKNSNAPKSEITVDINWFIDIDNPTEDGECLQRTFFDWDAASIKCIFQRMEDGGAKIRDRLKELTGLRLVNESKKLVSADSLGISSESPLNYREAGQVLEVKIQEDKSFRDLLYPLMGVRRRHLFVPKQDYRSQMDIARDEALRTQVLREAVVKATLMLGAGPAVGDAASPIDTM